MFENYSFGDLLSNIYKKRILNLIAFLLLSIALVCPLVLQTINKKTITKEGVQYSTYVAYKITAPESDNINALYSRRGYSDFYEKLLVSNLNGAYLFNDVSDKDLSKMAKELDTSAVTLKNSNADYWDKKVVVNYISTNLGVSAKILTPSKAVNDVIEKKFDELINKYKSVYKNVTIEKVESNYSKELSSKENVNTGYSMKKLLVKVFAIEVALIILVAIMNFVMYIFDPTINREGDYRKYNIKFVQEIKNNNQVILFLNRRGYSSFVSCRECGYVFECKNCDISLTYHKSQNIGKCHYCGYEEVIPKVCPECKSKYIKEFGLGTEKIEEEIKQIFEGVRVLRLDKDTTSQKYEMENILNKFQNKEADILIGTQMISKGLDFKHVTLVGILSADMMLNFPDFKSFENTFQLVTQVSGRAGRSEKEGKVILQAYDTDSSVIKRIVNYDFDGFYEDEIKIRKLFNYTPFNNMISVVVSGKNEYMVKKNITNFYNTLVYLLKERGISDFDFILGPNPCSISKINSNYRWQILFKDDNIEINLLKGIIKYICITKRELVFDKDVNISIDINPNSIL